MTKSIQVSDEAYEFLQNLSVQLNTQDNRHTDTPIFRIYEELKIEKRDGCGDHTARLDYEGAEEHYCGHCKDILKKFDYDYDKLPTLGEDDCYCDGISEAHWTYDIELSPSTSDYDGVAFLTEKAAQEYLESNHYHFTKGVVYAESAFRNHELKPLIKIVKEFSL